VFHYLSINPARTQTNTDQE